MSESRVAEDVEKVRGLLDMAERLAGFGGFPEDVVASLTCVLDALEAAQAELREKDETIARLREALGFYADRSNYSDGVVVVYDAHEARGPNGDGEVLPDGGEIARAALAEQGDEG